tara:strand:- start:6538 stop:7104 length:567 start_codon:yes stop_codon:yes gene_type:complete
MKNLLLITAIIFSLNACQTPPSSTSEEDKETFKRHYTAFLDHHVKGFATEDLELVASYMADSVQWSPPVWNNNTMIGKKEMLSVVQNYFDEFDNLTFLPGDGGIDSKGAFWGGSYYSEVGEETSEPNGIRVYGTWTGTHTASGATINNKWYAVISYNKDGKVVMFSDWMDVSGMQAQIAEHMAAQTEK